MSASVHNSSRNERDERATGGADAADGELSAVVGLKRRAPGLRGLRHHSVRWNLRAAMYDGGAYAVMVGLGQEIISPFVLAAQPGAAVAAGLVLSVPLLIGAVMQLVSPWVVQRLGSLRTAVVLYTLVQAAALVGLGVCAAVRYAPLWLIFGLAGVYWASGLGGGAAWSTWMPGNVPPRVRARYFGFRTRVIHGCTVGGLVLSGAALQVSKGTEHLLLAFGMLFFAAGVVRCVGAIYQMLQAEGSPLPPNHRAVSIGEIARRVGTHPGLRLMRYMLVVQFTVWIAHGFLSPFALHLLKFNYVQNQMLIAAPYLTRMLILPLIGTIAHNHGAQRVLSMAGVGVVPLSALWMASDAFAYLLAVQLVAGVVWAAYELSTFLVILETIPDGERTSIMTTYYLANAMAMVSGAVVGGFILRYFDKSHDGYMAVFGLSLAARAVSLVFLHRLTPRRG